ncbi:MAG TPA: hypothetical protein VEI95_07970 [Acidobacteriota bacterium]|nr:hypothetical protein [Acidobacteriota bacterium]
MNDTAKPLLALVFVFLVLLGLLLLDPRSESSLAMYADGQGKVSELGLRFSLER